MKGWKVGEKEEIGEKGVEGWRKGAGDGREGVEGGREKF